MDFANCTTAAANQADEPLTLEKLEKLKEALVPLPVCPFRQFMKAKGYNPDNGDFMVLPRSLKPDFTGHIPDYVKFSVLLDGIVLIYHGLTDSYTKAELI